MSARPLQGEPGHSRLDGVEPTREQLRDLAALLALPRIWRGRDPSAIAESLLDVLMTLLRLDISYLRLAGDDAVEFEAARPVGSRATLEDLRAHAGISEPLVRSITHPQSDGTVRLMRLAPDVDGEGAVLLIGSARGDFPTELESFLCRVAVEQAMLAIRSSRLVASLKAANAAKATFLATMSHELRTPLNAVLGYVGILQAGIGGQLSQEHHNHVERIEAAARHLIELIEGILGFARLEAGKERVHLAPASARAIAESVIALVEPLARAKSLRLDFALPETDVEMYTDTGKVRQILLNLLSNAIKFTSVGGVTLLVEPRGAEIHWAVSDTGIGIEPADLPNIFEPFRQVGDVHTKRAPGTGLGLSVSRELARLLGGDVATRSTPRVGSTFVVRLPVRSQDTSAPSLIVDESHAMLA